MALKLLMVVLAVVIARVFSYDLSGIRVSGNRFVNNAGQEVTLKVRDSIVDIASYYCVEVYKRDRYYYIMYCPEMSL